MEHRIASNLGAGHAWETVPASLELLPDTVHVWRVRFLQTNTKIADLWPILSEGEKKRASRWLLPEDRDAYMVSHSMMRDALARYCAELPAPLQICYGAKGQPHLLQGSEEARLHFSLSHSKSMALLAVTLDQRVGIDLEHQSGCHDWRGLAGRYFSPVENSNLFALPESEQKRAFLWLWTHKEAYLKARGDGLSAPLDSCVFVETSDGTLTLSGCAETEDRDAWSFLKLEPDEQHLGVLAVAGDLGGVQFWDWNLLPGARPVISVQKATTVMDFSRNIHYRD
jgi:4'-phosphopantetheinyl transferase